MNARRRTGGPRDPVFGYYSPSHFCRFVRSLFKGCCVGNFRDAFDAHLRRAGDLTSEQAVLLMILACEHSASGVELCRDIGTGGREFEALLEPLRANAYIVDSPRDVTITSEGERAVAGLWGVQERVEDGLYAGFTTTEREQLQQLLQRIQNNAVQVIGSAEH